MGQSFPIPSVTITVTCCDSSSVTTDEVDADDSVDRPSEEEHSVDSRDE